MIWYRIFHKAAILFRVPLFFAVKAVCQGVWRMVAKGSKLRQSTSLCRIVQFVKLTDLHSIQQQCGSVPLRQAIYCGTKDAS